ncbi:MAG: DNA polymerase domain-containing protein [Desulfobaccales bacterium]|jgi:DNA polymerase-2
METNGWLFDLYPLGDRLVLWFITEAGARLRLEDEFPYCLYLGGPRDRLAAIARSLEKRGWLSRVYPARGRDLWTGKEIPVLALEVRAYGLLFRLRHWLGTLPAEVECYNCDLDVASYYLYARRLYPCAWYHLEVGEGRRLRRLDPLEEAFALEFSPPPLLTTLTLSLTRDPLIPLAAGNGLALGWEGRTLELAAPDRPGLLGDLARLFKRLDPDLVLSDWGDKEIIPTLSRWSRETGAPLPLDRERGPVDRKFGAARSYFSYGRIVYQGAAAPFYGRWHLDRRNSFYYRESGLAGLMQISRIGQMPLQRAARASPGTLITSMQLSRATADGILIPWRKGEPEGFKTAGQLLTIDKGGLSFMPPPGLHFNVAEVDFASMYPTIMARHNISPETVNCPCCAGTAGIRGQGLGASKAVVSGGSVRAQLDVVNDFAGKVYVEPPPPAVLGATRQACCRGGVTPPLQNPPVPEAGYHLCRKREGLVPRTLRPILALREQLKARAREVGGEAAVPYRERQTALKWMLVTCFGYLGYKNARFGKIEAHEAVTAHGRDKLLTAKEISEAAGFRVLHGLTDCLWLEKPGLNESELEELCIKISAATGVKLALEGVYRWLCFMSSKQDPKRPVATRYFGVFEDGSLKVRGLACRRRDTPPLVRRAQEDLLARMAGAGTAQELAALRPELEEMAAGFRQRLREGSIKPRDLVITRVLSQKVADYKVDTPTALAARQLENAGIHIQPGEKVRYVHAEKKGGPKECRIQAAPFLETLDDYDVKLYLELLERAIEEILKVYDAYLPAT